MIDQAYVQRLARYNRWQNRSLYAAADTLSDAERRRDRGAFWGSIHGTLAHILWGDQQWMVRLAGTPSPRAKSGRESIDAYPEWAELTAHRIAFDEAIIRWADGLDPKWLAGDLTYYSGIAKRDLSKPKWLLVTHLFNHQTHHRGQAHCMLTAAGAKPADTDLPFMPDSELA